jgi:hypothetical protein
MRKLLLVCCFLVLSASAALAQGKIAVKWDCGAPDPAHVLDAGDQPNHVFSIGQMKCTAVSGEIAGVKQQSGVGTEFHELTGNSDSFKGVFVETLANGDKIHYTYEGTATMQDGALVSAKNTWSSTSATGSLKGIKASGTCNATGKPDGGAKFECSGEYTLAK